MIDNEETIVLFETSKSYEDNFLDKLHENAYYKLRIDFNDLDKSWNPLELPRHIYMKDGIGDTINVLESLAKYIFDDPNSVDPFWNDTAKDFMIGCVLNSFENDKNVCFKDIYQMSDLDNEKLKTLFDVNSKSYTYASTIILAPLETRMGIISTFKQKLRKYVIKDSLNEAPFIHIHDLSKKSFIVIKNFNSNSSYASLASVYLEQLYKVFCIKKDFLRNNHIVIENLDSNLKINELSNMMLKRDEDNIKFCIFTDNIKNLENNKISVNNVYVKETKEVNLSEDIIKSFEDLKIKLNEINQKSSELINKIDELMNNNH